MRTRTIGMCLAIALVTFACGSSDDDGSAELVGTWVGRSPRQPSEVTFIVAADGSFTWSALDVAGTWDDGAEGLRLTFSDQSSFCPSGYLVWEYAIDDARLTADVVGGDCGEATIDLGPPSPDWTFDRRSD